MNKITKLKDNEIFVFGSNYAGKHGKGAALIALKKFGARNGVGTGLMGKCYGIATKDRNLKILPLKIIESQIGKFIRFAKRNPNLTFLVTPIGCGLAGYKPLDIAPLFFNYDIPENVKLPDSFLILK
jgi:hypothetical protein